jgi:type 1 fimbria pilin
MRDKLNIPLFMLAIMLSGSAIASDTITLNGAVVAPSCDITADATQNIDLGAIPANTLTTVGQITSPVQFSVHLTNCNYPATLMWTYTGTTDDTGKNLALTDTPDTASGLAVAVFSDASASTPVDLNTQQTAALTGDAYTLDTWLAYKVTSLPVTAGSANATLYVDFAYQ